ncbi:TPA: hypothetical protein NIW09_002735 [Klebsiella pneumoniae]|uniref:hypothetical protein n=1 Tax=Klebsiella pneumoniae TaxID=573 RepID=UPI001C804DBE|nr:hypothetical protein [Klebsiella pneumoniae]MBX4517576.1 hypothetical protein [Klebsiella pneumoniae]HCF8671116.1 hypothetical protein [Klebsiella pneumoniae]HCT7764667.1 hypothetical protein [Klebsiella pneumoniae]
MTDIPRCPVCGSPPEFHWKNYVFGSCSGALKCPGGHIRVQQGYWAGGQSKAKKLLIENWAAAVANSKEGKK